MGYTESQLATNERIVYRTKQHWMAPIFGTVAGVLVLVGGVVLFALHFAMGTDGIVGFLRTLAYWASVIMVLVGIGMVGYSYIQWWVEDYVVTNQKVLKVAGLMRKRTSGAALEKINDVIMEQGPLGRMLGYGTLQVSTASDSSDLLYRTMRSPAEFRRAMLDEKQDWEAADARMISAAVREQARPSPAAAVAAAEVTTAAGAAPAPATPVAAAPTPAASAPVQSPEEKLRSLAALRDDGIITPEEFEAKKAALLAEL
jgi:uncharacterized membrane protein YdbT with pleckstrin-like domain